MPLVLVSSGQMVICPQSWSVPDTSTHQDVMGNGIMLEQEIANNIDLQKSQIKDMKDLLSSKKFEPLKSPNLPEIKITEDTPTGKKRRILEVNWSEEPEVVSSDKVGRSYKVTGVHSLPNTNMQGMAMMLRSGTSASWTSKSWWK